MTVIDWLRLFASIYILAIPLMWRGVAIDESIAVGIAMVAMSGAQWFERVQHLLKVYREVSKMINLLSPEYLGFWIIVAIAFGVMGIVVIAELDAIRRNTRK